MWYKKVSELLKNKLNLEQKELKVIKDFSILWSIFEYDFCGNNSSIANVEKKIKTITFDKLKFRIFYNYLKNRYTNNEWKFNSLEFRANDRRDFVEKNLFNKDFENIDVNDLILTLYIIVYRFRNNYFHWLKARYDFYDQYDNFRYANMFLVKLIKSKNNS